MRKIILLYILLLPLAVVAQRVPPELEQQLHGKTKLNEIMGVVRNYYTVTNPERQEAGTERGKFESSAYLKWLRWEWYMRPRLDSNGDFFDYRKLKEVEFEKLATNRSGLTEATNSQWAFAGPHASTHTSGDYRGLGRVDCIAFHPTDPSTIFVGTPGGGVWKTTNDGATWDNISFNLPNTSVSSIAVSPLDPNIIYIATGDARQPIGSFVARYNRNSIGIYKTTDGGVHWNPTSDNITVTGNATKIIVHPANPDIVLVATTTGIYKTIDGGNQWSLRFGGSAYDICFKPGDASRVYAAVFSASPIRYSTDGGNFFSFASSFNISPSANRIKLAVTPAFPSAVFALMGPFRQSGTPAINNLYEGLYYSNDNGVNFTRRNNSPNILSSDVNGLGAADEGDQSFYDLALAVKANNFFRVAAGGKCVWRSTDAGNSFESATDFAEITGQLNRYIHPDIQDLGYSPLNNNLYAATDGGFFRSTDDGITWTDISTGIHTTMFYKLAGSEQNGNMFIGGTQDNGLKFRNTATPAFNHIAGGDGFDALIDPNNANIQYGTANGPRLEQYLNGVRQADIVPAGAANGFVLLAHHPTQSGRIYAAFGNGIWRINTSPASSTLIRTITGANNRPNALVSCRSDGNRIYFADQNGIYRSDDQGANWTANLATTTAGFPATIVITDLFSFPGNADVVYAVNSNSTAGQKVYYSTNAGASWINISGTLPNVAVNCIAVDNNNNAYLGTDVGVFYQAAAEVEWVPFYNGLPKVIISDIFVNNTNNIVTAATYGHGVWQTDRFTDCSVNYNVTGSYTGERFYSVSNQLTSNAVVYGGDGTKIHFRAANEIVLNDGFSVYETSNFDGIIAPCNGSPVPQRNMYEKIPSGKGTKTRTE